MAAVQDVQKSKESSIVINVNRVNNTTSREEKEHGSMHYIVSCPMKEIFKINIDANLRDYYGSEDSVKNNTAIHREIRDSFEDNPTRFIQRHTGFTVVCSEIEVPATKELGINPITLTNSSLINGAQSQGLLKEISEEYGGQLDNTNIRIEIIVEKNLDEVREIAIARNTSNNVSVLSRMGHKGDFNDLQRNMWDVLGKGNGDIQTSETMPGVSTQTLLQVIKAMTPEELELNYKGLKKSAVTAYSSKMGVLTEFRKMIEDPKQYEDMLNYFHTFSGYAWKEYQSWLTDKDWIPFQKKVEKIGKYNDEKGEILMQWAIICPTLYGLKNFLVQKSGKWMIDPPSNFNRKDYMSFIFDLFKKEAQGVLQDFAKDRATYSDVDKYTYKVLKSQ